MEAVMDPIAQTIEEPVDAVTHAPVPVRAVSVRAPRRGRVLAFVYTGAGLAMVPWLFVLGSLLPATTVVPHYSLAWIGLDSLEAVGLFTTGRLLRRGDQRYALTAAVTATAMLIDAWFDVLGSVGAGALALSVGMAVLAEIPIAAVCIYLAVNALRPHPAPAPGGPASES